MSPEPPSATARLLAGLSIGGARPFSYRQSVYRLLGAVPPAGGSLYFSPNVPPPALHYLAPPAGPAVFMGAALEQPSGGVRSQPAEYVNPAVQHDRPHARGFAPSPETGRAPGASGQPAAGRSALKRPPARANQPQPAATPRELGSQPAAAAAPGPAPATLAEQESPDTVADREPREAARHERSLVPAVSLLVPGMTRRRSLLSALSVRLATSPTDPAPPAPPNRPRREAGNEQEAAAISGADAATPSARRRVGSLSSGDLDMPRQRERAGLPTPTTPAPRVTTVVPAMRSAKDTLRLVPAPTRHGPPAAPGTGLDTSPEEAESVRRRSTAHARGLEAVERVRDALEQRAALERVRRAIVRSEAGEAGRHTDTRPAAVDQPQPAGATSPPPHAAPVPARRLITIMTPVPQPSRVPRSFWSTSVLRCRHLRSLR